MGDADDNGKRSFGVLLEVREVFLAMAENCRRNRNDR
jgi:hypothetical protein